MMYRQFYGFILALLVCGLAGCPKPPGAGTEALDETGMVTDVIATFGDLARSPDTFETAWVEGKVPDEKTRKKYQAYFQDPDLLPESQPPKIEGNQATVEIQLFNLDDPDTVIETITWTVVKVGDEWKLDDAPLPSSYK